ncbi:GntR family transcriptional regulator [Eilatimonas milleporae]|uniref:Regulatory GntR family protein n=1 Tax=Eilatimonas milleporae TaxID=911205 RepID=A0A3M0CVM3_9PROT|nr:GntR family transcriptional regulator [Eilatimonas milleporae]RMB07673.1 regulatory GntR family protein [Eilatimonas milleporae]
MQTLTDPNKTRPKTTQPQPPHRDGTQHHDDVPDAKGHTGVYDAIKAMVITHELGPGARIRLEPLADRLRVSNTPVREALIQLAAERVISDMPKAGFFTKDISEAETRDLYRLGQHLLDWSLAAATRNRQIPGLLKPPKLFDIGDRLADLPAGSIVEMMDDLFNHIARQSGNADIVHMTGNINDRTHYIRLQECTLVEDMATDVAALCALYYARELKALRPALNDFHEKRLALLPDVIRAVRQARTERHIRALQKQRP